MRNMLVLEMYHVENNERSLGYADITVNDDCTVKVNKIGEMSNISKEKLIELIKGRDIITKSNGTLHSRINEILGIEPGDPKPCRKIIGVTRAYAVKGAEDNLESPFFSDLRSKFNIRFEDVEDYRTRTGIDFPATPIMDSVIFVILILEKDLAKRYCLYNDTPPAKKN